MSELTAHLVGPATLPLASVDLPRGRILIVDDESPLRGILLIALAKHGYQATGVDSGEAALAALATGAFEVVLTDLVMPRMGGIELLQTVLGRYPRVVTIVITAHGTIPTAIEALRAGALDYILKPFELGTLMPVLDRAFSFYRLRRENAELAQRVQEHAAELEVANRDLESFSYSVSHDLRAPLRAVMTCAQILGEDHGHLLPPEGLHLLQRMVAGSHRMEHLIDALLALATAARQSLVKQRINMAELTAEILAELRTNYPLWPGHVTVGELPNCDGDSALIRQLLTNLLSNAFKFTRDRALPEIEVGSRWTAGAQTYFIRDNGVGFKQSEAEQVFLAFQRLHSGAHFSGSGIGLSIVQRIAERHGGRVWAESEPDQGATFLFSFPGSAA